MAPLMWPPSLHDRGRRFSEAHETDPYLGLGRHAAAPSHAVISVTVVLMNGRAQAVGCDSS